MKSWAPTARRCSAQSTAFAVVRNGATELDFLKGCHVWKGNPRHAQTEFDKIYREKAGVDARGASVSDPKDVSTYAHMFGCWETLHVIKKGMETAGYAGPKDRAALIAAVEAMTDMPD